MRRTDLDGPAWLQAIVEQTQPLIDPEHHGVHGGFYRCVDPLSFVPETPLIFHELDDVVRDVFFEGMKQLSAEFVSGTFLSPGVVRGSTTEGWAEIPPVRSGALSALGLADVLNIVAVEPDGTGCGFASFRRDQAPLPVPERHVLRLLARHFVAAHRLHRRYSGGRPNPDLAAAVLDGNGRLYHAQGSIGSDRGLREALTACVSRSEKARGRRRSSDPIAALACCDALIAGRWTFVDHFDHDGRRYLLAIENAPRAPGIELLSPRERAVVELALRGMDNKVIAYELGVAHSTVKVLIGRAARKVGVQTRAELLLKLKLG
ncbi:MAG TPA: LuxR C-terminal-related transcriptional regulator [Polyangiaceae bacterium]|nr:LuxR C-terminal-related transcriptional regulator [Polyangiaceae bacterium]